MKLSEIQQKLKAPKNQFNAFGKYNYRNCEDILEALKPLLGDSVLTLSDEVVQVGNRNYVRATATFTWPNTEIFEEVNMTTRTTSSMTVRPTQQAVCVTAYACEAEDRKGMDASQITGAASSYARKYALNGLFLIDDTKDADHGDNSVATPRQTAQTARSATPVKDPDTGSKIKIAGLLSDLGHKGLRGEVFIAKIVELTQLEVIRENYEEIIERLELLKEEASQK